MARLQDVRLIPLPAMNSGIKIKTIPFKVASPNMKCSGINLTKYKQGLNEDHMTLDHENKEETSS